MEIEIKGLREDIKNLVIDVALIKNALLNETELTDWANEELKKAREEGDDKYLSLDELWFLK